MIMHDDEYDQGFNCFLTLGCYVNTPMSKRSSLIHFSFIDDSNAVSINDKLDCMLQMIPALRAQPIFVSKKGPTHIRLKKGPNTYSSQET